MNGTESLDDESPGRGGNFLNVVVVVRTPENFRHGLNLLEKVPAECAAPWPGRRAPFFDCTDFRQWMLRDLAAFS